MSSAVQAPVQKMVKNGVFCEVFGSGRVTDPITIGKSLERYAKTLIQKNRGYIKTYHDMLSIWYPDTYGKNNKNIDNLHLMKADNPFATSDAAAYAATHGTFVWSQVSLEAKGFNALDKEPWIRSGWKVKTARGTTANTGGRTETAVLPDTVHPVYLNVNTSPKIILTSFNVTALQQELSLNSNDDMFEDTIEQIRMDMGEEHLRLFNEHLFTDVDTLAGDNMESLDRVISSGDEETSLSLTAGDPDIYGIDRTASAWADSYVNHNSGVDRDFTFNLLDTLFENTADFYKEGDRRVLITGHDTYNRIVQSRNPQVQFTNPYLSNMRIQQTVNGVKTEVGIDAGYEVAAYRNTPIIRTNVVPVDTISRVYLVNLEYVKEAILMPTQYFQTGLLSNGNPFGINFLGDEGLFATILELRAYNFKAHGKLRDLK
jgi:hypothetical protein